MAKARISESELELPVLKLLAKQSDGYLRTSDIISNLEDQLHPEGEDASILDGRNDTKFSQKVRNIVSHKKSPTNLIGKGYAEYIKRGLKITPAGLDRIAGK
ncbi:MAG: hypothetical protein AB7I36_08610 [Rhodospirillaceae bacterium]